MGGLNQNRQFLERQFAKDATLWTGHAPPEQHVPHQGRTQGQRGPTYGILFGANEKASWQLKSVSKCFYELNSTETMHLG